MTSRARSSTRDDFDKVKDAAHKLRTENRRLRKENSQLRKELNRFIETEVTRDEEALEESVPFEAVVEVEEDPSCPKCKADGYKLITAGKFRINLCKACGYRKRFEIKR